MAEKKKNGKVTQTYALDPSTVEWVKERAKRLKEKFGFDVSASGFVQSVLDRERERVEMEKKGGER